MLQVLRDGSWDGNARLCRSAYRFKFGPTFRINFLGFRPAVAVTLSN